MKKTYCQPVIDIISLTMEVAVMGLSGQDEEGNHIIGDGGDGSGVDPDVNVHSLWDTGEEE